MDNNANSHLTLKIKIVYYRKQLHQKIWQKLTDTHSILLTELIDLDKNTENKVITIGRAADEHGPDIGVFISRYFSRKIWQISLSGNVIQVTHMHDSDYVLEENHYSSELIVLDDRLDLLFDVPDGYLVSDIKIK